MLGSWFTWKLLVESPKGLKTMFPSSFSLPADVSGDSQSINNPSMSVTFMVCLGAVRTHHLLLQLLISLLNLLW